eukprot:601481-Pyramimonas_sp.AAC.1
MGCNANHLHRAGAPAPGDAPQVAAGRATSAKLPRRGLRGRAAGRTAAMGAVEALSDNASDRAAIGQ